MNQEDLFLHESLTFVHDGDLLLLHDVIEEFIGILPDCRQLLLSWPSNPIESDYLPVFRYFHSFKGCIHSLNLKHLTHLVHQCEELLAFWRNHPVPTTRFQQYLLLQALDICYQYLTALREQIPLDKRKEATLSIIVPVMHMTYNSCLQEINRLLHLPNKDVTSAVKVTSEINLDVKQPPVVTPNHTFKVEQGKIDELITSLWQQSKITEVAQIFDLFTIPVEDFFRGLSNTIRTLSRELQKDTVLLLDRHLLAVDKMFLDQIKFPLIHILRNAVDHGIECNMDRLERKKPIPATIEINWEFFNGLLQLQIKDDGNGIDKEAVLRRARQLGWIDDKMKFDRSMYRFIFLPGFSTKESVTEISGRGIGLDAVKSQIESLGGSIQVASKSGLGTIFTIMLPIRMAVFDFDTPRESIRLLDEDDQQIKRSESEGKITFMQLIEK